MDIVDLCVHPLVIFIFTLSFALLPKLLKNFKISAYCRCFTGGVILSIMIFHIFVDLYEEANDIYSKITAGLSFLILFFVEKAYLDYQLSHDSIPDKITKLQAFVFVIALSIHSFFEGFAILVSEGKKSYYIVSLLGHKWIEAFSLGMSVEFSEFGRIMKFLLIVFYSSLTPIGESLGFVTYQAYNLKIVKNILIGISSGSFFYIGFIEMLNSEFRLGHNLKTRIRKLAVIFVSFVAMSTFFMTFPE